MCTGDKMKRTAHIDLQTVIFSISFFGILFNPFGWYIIGHMAPLYCIFSLWALIRGKTNGNHYKSVYILCLLFLIYVIVSYIFIAQYTGTLKIFFYFVVAVLVFIIFSSYKFKPFELRFILKMYVVSSYFIVLQMAVQRFNLEKDPNRYTVTFAGQQMDPNFLAASLIVPLIINFYHCELNRFKCRDIFFCLIPLAGILFTGSRGAFISSVIACFIIHFYENRLKKTRYFVVLNILLCLFIISFVVFLPDFITSRFNVRNFYDGSNSLRLNLWFTAVKIFLTSPITGRGTNSMLALGMEYGARINLQSHNAFLDILSDYGIIGLLTIGTSLLMPFFLSWKKRCSIGLAISLATLCCAFFLPSLYSIFLWQNMMIVFALLKLHLETIDNEIIGYRGKK